MAAALLLPVRAAAWPRRLLSAETMYQLVLRAPQALVEPVSDALVDELAALSVSVEDADAGNEAEEPLFGEPGMPAPRPGWQRSTLHALFADEAAASDAASLLLAQDWAADLHVQSLQPLPDQDWVRLTQAQFEPVAIADGFWVVPSWHAVPGGTRRVIRLDPGLAFGTGTHPTTRMCLRWLAGQEPALAAPGARVLDYGCGSGILAIGAALHGATDIDAVDIDPAAVQAAQDNASANAVAVRAGPPEQADGDYSVVMANILATPLKLLAPLLCRRLRPGGQLVLAGILQRQADDLKAAYAPWLALQVSDAQDGWVLMTGQLATGSPG
jgi:ribosomal protein L11 methyltransferase